MGNYSQYISTYIIIHEIGHVLGLRDINNKNSIMHFNDGGYARKVTKDANDAVVNKY